MDLIKNYNIDEKKLRKEVREELREEVREELRKEVREELIKENQQLINEVQDKLIKEIEPQLKKELRKELTDTVKKELKQEVNESELYTMANERHISNIKKMLTKVWHVNFSYLHLNDSSKSFTGCILVKEAENISGKAFLEYYSII